MKKILLYLPLIILIITSLFFIFTTIPGVRYWADDFCTGSMLHHIGFLGTQLSNWNSWTGRYTATLFTSFFEIFGQWAVNVLPFLLLTGIFAALYGFYKYGKILPVLFVLLALINAPNIIQSFYWQTGSLNYFAPFIFLNILLSFFVISGNKKLPYFSFILMLIAGGFSEAFALSTAAFLFIVILVLKFTNFKDKKEKIRIAYFGLGGTLLSLFIMYLSPGNAVREMAVTRPSSMMFVIKSTLLGTKWYLQRIVGIKDFIYSVVLSFAAIFIFGKNIKISIKDSLIIIGGSLISTVLATMAVIGSGFYSMSILAPERTLFIVVYMILISVFVISFAAGSLLRENLSKKYLNQTTWLILIFGILSSVLLTASVISHFGKVKNEIWSYANAWDTQVKELPVIKNIKPVGELDGFTDNKGWVAGCVAGYYNFGGLQIKD